MAAESIGVPPPGTSQDRPLGSLPMRLAVNLGYWGAGNDHENLALAQEADRLRYDSARAAGGHGAGPPTLLAGGAGQTTKPHVGAAGFQIPGRSPGRAGVA